MRGIEWARDEDLLADEVSQLSVPVDVFLRRRYVFLFTAIMHGRLRISVDGFIHSSVGPYLR